MRFLDAPGSESGEFSCQVSRARMGKRFSALWALVLSGLWSCGGETTREKTEASGGSGNAAGSASDSGGSGGEASGGMSGRGGSVGMAGSSGEQGSAGTLGSGGLDGGSGRDAAGGSSGGALGSGGDGASGSAGMGATGGTGGAGSCCPDNDCLCHGPDPTGLTSSKGPFAIESFNISTGVVIYPTDAEPPFAAVVIGTHFLSVGPEMQAWGSLYASHGIVTHVANASTADQPDAYATKLLAALEQLKAENTRSDGPLRGKLGDRYGISGHSIGGGAATLGSSRVPTLKTSVALAPWGGEGAGVSVPTLLFCGGADQVAPCSMSETVYAAIPEATPKMMVSIAGASHFMWFDPISADKGASGETALAFQKVFLEGDQRYKRFLLQSRGTMTTNIR